VTQWGKIKLLVQAVSVPRSEQPSTQALQIGLFHDHLHQPFTQPLAAMFLDHKNVANVGKCGSIVMSRANPTWTLPR
jgi:hypothetical protein